jgi:hypothetical protein
VVVAGGTLHDIDDQERNYEPEKILKKKTRSGRVHYLVKWAARYGSQEEPTWEPSEHLADAPDLIADFTRQQESKLGATSAQTDLSSETSPHADLSDPPVAPAMAPRDTITRVEASPPFLLKGAVHMALL